MRISELERYVDKTVTLSMADGEIARVKVDLVDEKDEELIGVVVDTSRPEHRRGACARQTFAVAEIVSVQCSE